EPPPLIVSRSLPGQSFLSLSPNMPWAAPLTVSRASSSLSLASALPCWALPSASVSLSSVTLPKPSLAWPPSLSFAFSNFSSALIANLLDRVSAQVLCSTASLGRQRGRLPTCRSGLDRYPARPRPRRPAARLPRRTPPAGRSRPHRPSHLLRRQRDPAAGQDHVHLAVREAVREAHLAPADRRAERAAVAQRRMHALEHHVVAGPDRVEVLGVGELERDDPEVREVLPVDAGEAHRDHGLQAEVA